MEPETKPPTTPRLESTGLPQVDIEEPVSVPVTVPVVSSADTGGLERTNKEDVEGLTPLSASISLDVSTLSAHEIYELNQGLLAESVPERPLIDEVRPMSVLREEYENGSASFVAQIDWLAKEGYDSVRRARGDGDCFYRSLAYAYVERILESLDPGMLIANSLSILESTLPALDQAGFQRIVFEDFYECFRDLIQNVSKPDTAGNLLTKKTLLAALQEPQLSNSICVYLRLVTSAQIRTNPDDYIPYLANPDMPGADILMEPSAFCERYVEATGVEADHVQIMALCTALKIKVKIAYLDGRRSDGVVDFVEMPEGAGIDKEPLVLLYRPGHYDILERSGDSLSI